ncbi:MAG: branched-chain amino acid aminotransferase [Arcobacter sp.]|nr:MAG: branched-chain amino acid aminotransferase [Arcobacter sp.]
MQYFETIKCDDYEVFNLDYHNRRIANTIGLNLNLQEYIYAPSNELLRCKVIYNEEGIENVEYFKYKKREIKSFKLVFDDVIDYSKKYLDRTLLDDLYKQRENADEIIIIKNGIVSDTSIANIVIFDGNNWITSTSPLLFGTTRARLLDDKAIFEKDITVEMLKKAEKIALMNAMIDFNIIEDYSFFL